MKITKKLIAQLMLKCWKRAKRNKKHFNAVNQLVLSSKFLEHRFYNIDVVIKVPQHKTSWGLMEAFFSKSDAEGNFPCRLTINPKAPFDLEKLEDVVAHELAHFLDFMARREAVHDFEFLHNYLILSNKKKTNSTILYFMAQYMVKPNFKRESGNIYRTYNDVLSERK